MGFWDGCRGDAEPCKTVATREQFSRVLKTIEEKNRCILCFSSPAESKLLKSGTRVDSRVAVEVNRQPLKTPKIDAWCALEHLEVEVQVGKSTSEFGEGHLRFEASQGGSQAGVNPMAKRH